MGYCAPLCSTVCCVARQGPSQDALTACAAADLSVCASRSAIYPRKSQHAVGIPCRANYRAAWDTMLHGLPCNTASHAQTTRRLWSIACNTRSCAADVLVKSYGMPCRLRSVYWMGYHAVWDSPPSQNQRKPPYQLPLQLGSARRLFTRARHRHCKPEGRARAAVRRGGEPCNRTCADAPPRTARSPRSLVGGNQRTERRGQPASGRAIAVGATSCCSLADEVPELVARADGGIASAGVDGTALETGE